MLIATVCTAAVEAAVDSQGHANDVGEQVAFDLGPEDHDSSGGEPDGCYLCCHIGAHLLGVRYETGG
jgi:hypothetical protein